MRDRNRRDDWTYWFIAIGLILYLCGCSPHGHAEGGSASQEKSIVQPKTTTTTIKATGMPVDQWSVFQDLWRDNPPSKVIPK